MDQKSVSIIIPNRNSKTIDKTISSLFNQTAFDNIKEILVIGTDEPGLVFERGPVRFLPSQIPISAPVARNIGIQQVRGTDFVFIDADCIAEPMWLATLLNAKTAEHQIIGGSVSFEGNNFWQLCYNLTMFHEFIPTAPAGYRKNLGTLNLLVSRKVVDCTGLLDENLVRCQDTEWTLRMRHHGYTLYFDPNAVVKHLPQVTGLPQILKLWCLTGFYSSQVRQKYPKLIDPTPFYNSPIIAVLLSPAIGAFVTTRIFIRNPRLFRYIHTSPVVFLTKIAWILGTRHHSPGSIK